MLNKIKQDRIDKLNKIIDLGIDPYPASSSRARKIENALADFEMFEKRSEAIALAGRIVAMRSHGGSIFANLKDDSGSIQIYFKKDNLNDKKWTLLENIDIGDFIDASGTLFTTKRGEKTVLVSDFNILSKSLLPLPDKWYGLEDKEIRFRKRYLDLLMNKDVKERFIKRSKIIKELRQLLDKEGFLEVETPILQPLAGGAAATPFVTHLNALDMDLYLRIAPEMYLKRIIVGGFEKIYEIGRCFRNEGMDRSHNPDFTMLEFYWAYKDYNFLMEFTEKLLSQIVKNITGGYKIKYQGEEIDFTAPWPRFSFVKSINDACGVDILELASEEKLRGAMEKLGIKTKGLVGFGKLADELYKETVRKKITNPVFIVDHPIQLGPLAKAYKGKRIVQRFQVVANGFEIVNAYSELNDPIEQRKRLEYQLELKKKGDDEAPAELDEDYIEAMEYGMPPIAGWGMGVDRFAALLTDAPSLREIILFPTMKAETKS
ncbi:lysine--tRNA ligase [Patescibacteria group bacterium]|nr:lysine--tRNA ligase [Patescibacteria group bacterium]